jgi:hypothetical protein
MGIPILELLDIIINNKDNLINKKVGGNNTSTLIHPDLVIQQAQLISLSFALQVSHLD